MILEMGKEKQKPMPSKPADQDSQIPKEISC